MPATSEAPLSRLLLNEGDAIAARSGVRFEVAGVAVGDVARASSGDRPGARHR